MRIFSKFTQGQNRLVSLSKSHADNFFFFLISHLLPSKRLSNNSHSIIVLICNVHCPSNYEKLNSSQWEKWMTSVSHSGKRRCLSVSPNCPETPLKCISLGHQNIVKSIYFEGEQFHKNSKIFLFFFLQKLDYFIVLHCLLKF